MKYSSASCDLPNALQQLNGTEATSMVLYNSLEGCSAIYVLMGSFFEGVSAADAAGIGSVASVTSGTLAVSSAEQSLMPHGGSRILERVSRHHSDLKGATERIRSPLLQWHLSVLHSCHNGFAAALHQLAP
jgi:hypothetical protein